MEERRVAFWYLPEDTKKPLYALPWRSKIGETKLVEIPYFPVYENPLPLGDMPPVIIGSHQCCTEEGREEEKSKENK